MLTGRTAFRGDTVTDTLAAAISSEPDWTKLPSKARRIVQRCLEKDPAGRLHHAADFALLLEESPAPPRSARRVAWPFVAMLLAVLAVALFAL